MHLAEGEGGEGGGQEVSEENLAGILYKLGLAAYAAAALLARATRSGHSLDQAGCLPLQLQQEWVAGFLEVGQLLEACSLAQCPQLLLPLHV